jgi:proline dehydrogenase
MLIDVQTASRTFTQILGERITNSLMKVTFFGHFCGGENNDDIQPTIKRLSEAGIGSILDYAAEADVGEPLADKEIVLEGA